jgi:hypothetical protein
MISYKARTAVMILFVFSLVPWALAQQPAATPTPAPQATPVRTPDYVDFTGFKGKVFDVKHRDPRSLAGALMSLGSGFKGAEIRFSDEFRTITVRDFPENISAVEEALKRLDTPQSVQPDVELRINILIATNVDSAAGQYPPDLGDVIKQMQAMLNYKSYFNLATVVQRVRPGARNIGINGNAEVAAKIIEKDLPQLASYNFRAQALSLTADSSGGYTALLSDADFQLQLPGPGGQAQIRSDLNLRNGEKVVVGTATLGNKGLIVVLSARVIK